jgi:Protein of unknown function (DUF2971)
MTLSTEAEIQIPEVLYKYRDLSGPNRDRVRQTIVENKVWFSTPVDFNDPFDCKVHTHFTGSTRTWKRHFREWQKNYRPEINRQQRRAEEARVLKVEKRHKDPRILASAIEEAQQAFNNWGIFCLSERNDDLLMWSYYADGHRGVCLGFAHRPTRPFGQALRVMYSSELPRVNYFAADHEELARANFLTKALSWKHESEWRVIDRRRGRGFRQFPPESLIEVIMGSQMSKEDRKDIMAWIETLPCRPWLFEARLKKAVYGLEINLVAPGTAKRGAA